MQWVRVLLIIPLLLFMGGWLIYSAIQAIQCGEANAGGTRIVYHARPIFFIITVFVQFGFGALFLYQAGVVLFTMIGRH